MLTPNVSKLHRRAAIYDLIFAIVFWFTGFLLAVCTQQRSKALYISLMRSAMIRSVSIVGLIAVVILPFVITVLISMNYKSIFLQILCLVKGYQFSICALSICSIFGAAGWLGQIVYLFTDTLSCVLLWWNWIFLIGGRKVLAKKVLFFTCLLYLLIIILDVYYIAPTVKSFMI